MAKNQSVMARFSASFVALPDPIKAGITAVIVYVISFVFANLLAALPFLAAFSQFVVPVALVIAIAVIEFIERSVPDTYGEVAKFGIQALLALLAVYGIGVELAARGALPALLSP